MFTDFFYDCAIWGLSLVFPPKLVIVKCMSLTNFLFSAIEVNQSHIVPLSYIDMTARNGRFCAYFPLASFGFLVNLPNITSEP